MQLLIPRSGAWCCGTISIKQVSLNDVNKQIFAANCNVAIISIGAPRRQTWNIEMCTDMLKHITLQDCSVALETSYLYKEKGIELSIRLLAAKHLTIVISCVSILNAKTNSELKGQRKTRFKTKRRIIAWTSKRKDH